MTIETRRNFVQNNNNNAISDPYSTTSRMEILKDRLYFATIDGSPVNDSQHFYFRTDEEFHYESFYDDFGPLNLAMLYRYCMQLQRRLKMLNLSKKRIVHYAPSNDHRQRANAAYLIGSFAIIFLHKTAEEVWRLFESAAPFEAFRDAALGSSTYDLELSDVFAGVEKAVKLNWLNFADDSFNVEEYEFYEKVENGDFNWIIPGKILAFCGPHNKAGIESGYPHHSPETYFQYFRQHNVTTIVRLNKRLYDSRRFTSAGFQHADLFFPDGSNPTDQIVRLFISIVEQTPGAVAVHCKAGLGRTGTVIACWMMSKFHLTAAECISWTRICRPGSVIGPQQKYLVEKQEWCWRMDPLPPASSLVNVMESPSNVALNVPAAASLNGLVSQVDDIKISGNNNNNNNSSSDIAMVGKITGSGSSSALADELVPDTSILAEQPAIETEVSIGALDNERNTQGEELMRIKATRGSGRNQFLRQPAKRNGDGTVAIGGGGGDELSTGGGVVTKRVLPGRVRRVSSMKEYWRNLKKPTSGAQTTSGPPTTAIPAYGRARKAAKHQAGADAASSISVGSASSISGQTNHADPSMRNPLMINTRRHQYSRAPRPVPPPSASSGSAVASPYSTMKNGRPRRTSPYKGTLIPQAVSMAGDRFDGTAGAGGSKASKPPASGGGSSSKQPVRPMHRSPSAFVRFPTTMAAAKDAETKDGAKKPSPYFLRRRSGSNVQTMLLPRAPTAVTRNIGSFSPSYAPVDNSNFPPQPMSSITTLPRRSANIYTVGKSKRITS